MEDLGSYGVLLKYTRIIEAVLLGLCLVIGLVGVPIVRSWPQQSTTFGICVLLICIAGSLWITRDGFARIYGGQAVIVANSQVSPLTWWDKLALYWTNLVGERPLVSG